MKIATLGVCERSPLVDFFAVSDSLDLTRLCEFFFATGVTWTFFVKGFGCLLLVDLFLLVFTGQWHPSFRHCRSA